MRKRNTIPKITHAIIGAESAEMEEVEKLLLYAGVEVMHAMHTTEEGKLERLHTGLRSAELFKKFDGEGISFHDYTLFDDYDDDDDDDDYDDDYDEVRYDRELIAVNYLGIITVNCEIEGLEPDYCISQKEGSPKDFLSCSIIGQTISLLACSLQLNLKNLEAELEIERDAETFYSRYDDPDVYNYFVSFTEGTGVSWPYYIPRKLILKAAAGHCLRSAYQGECPGVSPDELLEFRAVEKALFQERRRVSRRFGGKKITKESILRDIRKSAKILKEAVDIPGIPGMRDLRGNPHIPQINEASAYSGISFCQGPMTDNKNRRQKHNAFGTPEQCKLWLKIIGKDLIDTYGDPERGFVGGYENE